MKSALYPTSSKNMMLLCGFIFASLLLMNVAFAQFVPANYITGNCSALPSWMVTSRLVGCIEFRVRTVMNLLLFHLTINLLMTIIAVMAFSLVLFGIKVFAGLEDLTKDSILYIIKFGCVFAFSFFLGGFSDAPVAIMRYATSLVVGMWSPWAEFDMYLGRLFGFGSAGQLSNGLMGMVFAAMFSGVSGILVLVLSLLSMFTTIYFAFRAILTYISAFVLLSFLVALTPLLVPLILFAPTHRYVDKWISYIIACIVHPVILFAFLRMFMGTINTMLDWFIDNVFSGNNDFSMYYRGNRNLFSWIMTADPSTVRALENTLGDTSGRTALQTFASPVMSQAVDINPINTFALDFGANQVWMLQGMVFGFLGLFIVSYLMLSMLNYLPEVADSITGIITALRFEGIPFVSEFKQTISKMKGSVT